MKVLMDFLVFAFLVISCASSAYVPTTEGSPYSPMDSNSQSRGPGKTTPRHNNTYGEKNPGTKVCNVGHEQSPIDIKVTQCKTKVYPHVEFADNILFSKDVLYENNCETVKITMCDHTQKPKVRGGSLDNDTDYIIDNIHFHWGTKDTEGCEHTVSGKHFQVEAHLVVYKCTEKDLDTALANKHVAVLSFLFEFQGHKVNPELDGVIKGVTEVLQPHSSYKAHGESLVFLKNYINGGFYTYRGSLTTHYCTEGILWMVFKTHVPLAHSQLLIFHDVIGEDEEELQNWRRTLPLNGREVCQTSY